MGPFELLEHSTVLFMIGAFLFSLVSRLQVAGGCPIWLCLFYGVVAVSFIASYILFFVFNQKTPEQASLLLLSWTRLNGTLLEILAYGQLTLGLWLMYAYLIAWSEITAVFALLVQIAAIVISRFHFLKDLNPALQNAITHSGGLIFRILATFDWTFLLWKAHIKPRSAKQSLGDGFSGNHGDLTVRSVSHATFMYLVVTAIGLVWIWVEDERWAYLGDCLLECFIIIALARINISRASQESKRTALERSRKQYDPEAGGSRAQSVTALKLYPSDNFVRVDSKFKEEAARSVFEW